MSFLDFLSKPTRPLVGLDISSSAIKLIELSKSADGYRVEAYRVMALPSNTMVEKNIADIPALADTLEKLVTHSGTKLTDTAVAVSGSSVITKEIELPAGLSDLQMEMQIEVEADQYIPFLIDLELSALESDGYGEIVSQPKVLTGDKQQAVIKSGTEIAFEKATSSGATSIEFKEAVLQLEVTPQITPDNRIIMDLLVSQDSVGAFTPTGEPSIDITRIETQALVGDGQTLVLGGIFQTEEVNGTEKVPMLGDIPFLGKLFRNDLRNIEKREILIFITPKIIDDNLLDR
jgi:type IV pilus secretin PilQ/predicted competence protein